MSTRQVNMKENIEQIRQELNEKVDKIKTIKELSDLKVEYLGKKGSITLLTSNLKDLSIEEKKEFGMLINELRNEFNEKKMNINQIKLSLLLHSKMNEFPVHFVYKWSGFFI